MFQECYLPKVLSHLEQHDYQWHPDIRVHPESYKGNKVGLKGYVKGNPLFHGELITETEYGYPKHSLIYWALLSKEAAEAALEWAASTYGREEMLEDARKFFLNKVGTASQATTPLFTYSVDEEEETLEQSILRCQINDKWVWGRTEPDEERYVWYRTQHPEEFTTLDLVGTDRNSRWVWKEVLVPTSLLPELRSMPVDFWVWRLLFVENHLASKLMGTSYKWKGSMPHLGTLDTMEDVEDARNRVAEAYETLKEYEAYITQVAGNLTSSQADDPALELWGQYKKDPLSLLPVLAVNLDKDLQGWIRAMSEVRDPAVPVPEGFFPLSGKKESSYKSSSTHFQVWHETLERTRIFN